MCQNFIASFLTIATIFGIPASLRAQYEGPPDQGQQYPQAQQQVPEQGSPAEQQAGDPQRSVARLSILQGDVNVKRGDSGDLVAAAINAPLLTQDHLQTSVGSRAEVQLDSANMIRLAPNTDLGFGDLEYHRYPVQLGAGTIIYRVLRDSNAQGEVDTPSVAVRPTQQGDYRISVLDNGSTQITVHSGELEVYSPRGTQTLQAGQTMVVRGDSSDPQFQMTDQIVPDQFDDWSANRDRELLASRSYQYVSHDIYGADDLDAYGTWVPSQYGNVWEPRDRGADWAPYSNGEWVSEPYYGWTWVDDEPWGWAPYHYGRWFDNPGHGWCWWPGSVELSYSWSPAVVGFFGWGGGGGFGIGVGWGAIGWTALAPFETFNPWWGGGYGNYTNINNTNITNINIVNNTNITNIYRNACVKGGAVTAASNKFGGPNKSYGRATQAQLRNANLFRGRMPVTPTRTSGQFSARQATPNPRLASAANRQFYHSPTLAQAPRATSAQKQMRAQPGSPVAGNAAALPHSGGFARAGQPGFNNPQRGQASAISRGNAPRALQNSGTRANIGSAPQQSFHGMPPNTRSQLGARNNLGPSTQASGAGWHRFGETGPQSGRATFTSRGSGPSVPQNSGTRANIGSAPQQSFHGMPPNLRSQTAGRSNLGPSTQASASGWHRFGEPGISTGSRRSTAAPEQSAWHSFGQPQRASGGYGGARPGSIQTQPNYGRSFSAPSYGGNYQSRPLANNQLASRSSQNSSPSYRGGYNSGGRSAYSAPSMPHYNAPSAPRYSAPSMQHYNAPSAPHYGASSMPHYNAPSAPRYSAPSMQHYNAPSAPHYSAPSMPHYNAPSAPHYSAPSMPHYNAPSAPHNSAPSMPHYNAPSAPHYSGSGGGNPPSDGHRSR
jgi:hypothetical protein